MAEQRLIDYIKDNIQRGYSADYLRQILLEQGWGTDEVDEAFGIALMHPLRPAIPSQSSPPPVQPTETGPAHGETSEAAPEKAAQEPKAETERKEQKSEPGREAEGKPKPAPRPTGVTLFCMLGFLTSALLLVAGILILIFGPIITGGISFGNETALFYGNETGFPGIGGIGLFSAISGAMFITLAIVEFAGFLLLWKMKRIGWILVTVVGVIMVAVNLASNLTSFNINNVLIAVLLVLITGYIFTKRKLFV